MEHSGYKTEVVESARELDVAFLKHWFALIESLRKLLSAQQSKWHPLKTREELESVCDPHDMSSPTAGLALRLVVGSLAKSPPGSSPSDLVLLLKCTLTRAAQQPLNHRSAHLWSALSAASCAVQELFLWCRRHGVALPTLSHAAASFLLVEAPPLLHQALTQPATSASEEALPLHMANAIQETSSWLFLAADILLASDDMGPAQSAPQLAAVLLAWGVYVESDDELAVAPLGEQYVGFFSIMVYQILCAQTVAPSLAICEGLGSHAETVATALISTAVRGLVRSVSEVGLEGIERHPGSFIRAAKTACAVACPELRPAVEKACLSAPDKAVLDLGEVAAQTANLVRLGIGAAAERVLDRANEELLHRALGALQRLCSLLAKLQASLFQDQAAAAPIQLALHATAAQLVTTLNTHLPKLDRVTALQPPGQSRQQQHQRKEQREPQAQALCQLLAQCVKLLAGCMGDLLAAVNGGTAKLSCMLAGLCNEPQVSSAAVERRWQTVLSGQEQCRNLQLVARDASTGVVSLVEGVLGLLAAHHTSLGLLCNSSGSSVVLLAQVAQVAGSLVLLMRQQLRAWQLHPDAPPPGGQTGLGTLERLCVQTASLLTMLRKATLVAEFAPNSLLADHLVEAAKFTEQLLDAAIGRLSDLAPGTRRTVVMLCLSASRALSTIIAHGTVDSARQPSLKHDLSWLGITIVAKGCWAGPALKAEAVRLLKSWQCHVLPLMQEDATSCRHPSMLLAALADTKRLCMVPVGALLVLESGFVAHQASVLCQRLQEEVWEQKENAGVRQARRALAEIVSICCESLDELFGTGQLFRDADHDIDVKVKRMARESLGAISNGHDIFTGSGSRGVWSTMAIALCQGWLWRSESLLPRMAYTLRAAMCYKIVPRRQLPSTAAGSSNDSPTNLGSTQTVPTAPASQTEQRGGSQQQQEQAPRQRQQQSGSDHQQQGPQEQHTAEQQMQSAVFEQPSVPAAAVEVALAFASAGLCGNVRCKTLVVPAYTLAARKPPALRCAGCRIVSYCGQDCARADWPLHRDCCLLFRQKELAYKAPHLHVPVCL